MTLYFAYGSNLNLDQMVRRCPDADPVGALALPNWKLVFRGVADIVPADGEAVQGGLWKITPECERALDRYEGYDAEFPDSGMYSKKYVLVDGLPDGETTVMFYVMNSQGIYPPSHGYFAGVKDGYRDFGLPLPPLMAALKHAYDDKRPSHVERQRMRRTGRPALAARPSVTPENTPQLSRKQKRKAAKKAKAANKAEQKAAAEVLKTYEKRAAAKANHDPWASTSFKRRLKDNLDKREKRRPSLDQWLADKYYNGERF